MIINAQNFGSFDIINHENYYQIGHISLGFEINDFLSGEEEESYSGSFWRPKA